MPPQDPHNNNNNNNNNNKNNNADIIQNISADLCDDENSNSSNNNNNNGVGEPFLNAEAAVSRSSTERMPNNNNNNNSHRSSSSTSTSHRSNHNSDNNSQRRRRSSFVAEFSGMRGPPQIALLMVLLAIGLGSTIGVVPAIMGDRFARLRHGYDGQTHCGSFHNDPKPEACFLGGSDAQAAAALVNLISNGLTFLTASLSGSLSDEYGRKGLLILGLTLSMIPAFFLCVLQDAPNMSPWWYYSASAATGLVSWVAIALSALNDVLPQELRAPGIGLLFAGMLLGISVSPSLALFLDRKSLTRVGFGVVVLGFLLTVFWVPETVPWSERENARERRSEREALSAEKDRRRAEEECEGIPCSRLWKFYFGSPRLGRLRRFFLRPFWEMSILNRNCFFRLISALAFFTGMVTSGDQVLLVYYLEEQLSFDAKDISVMFLEIGVAGIFVQVVVMKLLNDAVGEKMVVALSFLAGTVTNLLYGTARHKTTIFVAVLVSSFSTMAFPTISAIKANNVENSEQGRIQGALYSIQSLASGLGPALMQMVYSVTKDHRDRVLGGPGTMFISASALFVIGIGLALALPKEMANTNPRHGGGGGGTAFSPQNYNNNNDDRDDEDEDHDLLVNEYQRLASPAADSQSDDTNSDYGSV